MMLAMFAGAHRDDWDDLLPAVMMAYRSSVHELTGFSPYRLMFGEECTPPTPPPPRGMWDYLVDPGTHLILLTIRMHYESWDALEVAYDQVRCHAGQAVPRQKRLYAKRAVKHVFAIGDWTMRYYPPAKKCKLDSPWLGPYLVVALTGWAVGVQLHPDSLVIMIDCQD